jgi:prevent-host-death family protein
MKVWQLQEAKARFSELVRRAGSQGPQDITLHGRRVAVLVSGDEFDRLTRPRESFVDFMLRSPLAGSSIMTRRDKSPARKVRL